MLNKKKYLIEFGTSIGIYSAAIFFSISFIRSHPDSPLNTWIALLPVLPTAFAICAVIRALKSLDELQQRLQGMSLMISFTLVGFGSFSYGLLENVGFPSIPTLWIFPLMIATWGLVTPMIARGYR